MLDMKLRNGKALGVQERLSRRKADARTLRNQRASPLLRLPGEIRNTIYEYALGGHHIYLNEHRPSVKAIVIKTSDGEQISKDHLFALGHTCRQTRSESALMLFSRNDIFGYFWSAVENHRCELFTPSQRDAIRNISVMMCCFGHFKGSDLRIIVTFSGLKRITVVAAGGQYNAGSQVGPANIDGVNREIYQLFGREMKVTLKTWTSLYE